MYQLKDYLKAVNQSKEKLMDTEDEVWEKKYPAYIVNKCLAPYDKQTCLFVNEVNRRPHLENKLQFDFLINSLRRMNRYSPWQKAKSALTILNNEQIKHIKKKLNKGGRHGK